MSRKTLVVAAGCFWGVEELIRQVNGVIDTEVGYTGGHTLNPTYETVKLGNTGHAEAVKITYDSNVISFQGLLDLFFQLHDPTTRNRQGNDLGTQYRSAIFVSNKEEYELANKTIQSQNESGRWKTPVVTVIEDLGPFYSAETYHQDYLQKNPGGYTCHFWR